MTAEAARRSMVQFGPSDLISVDPLRLDHDPVKSSRHPGCAGIADLESGVAGGEDLID